MLSDVEEKKPTPPPTTPKLSLPDDLLLSCFARVSRSHYKTLSLVSKSFRSLLVSPELYQTRSLLGHAETCLYICLKFPSDPKPCWYSLTPNRHRKSFDLLVPTLIPNSPIPSRVVTVGSNIYNIGGSGFGESSSRISILRCGSNMWYEGPSMRVKRNFPAVSVFDGKIYVVGGCKDCNPTNWMEVFDTKTKTWESVLCPLPERYRSGFLESAVIKGTIYIYGEELVAYKPMEDRWEILEKNHRYLVSGCVIDNVRYSSSCYWYDSKIGQWREVKSLTELPIYHNSKMVDCGGKMAVFWENDDLIHCGVIALERRNQEIWGKVEWYNAVLKVPRCYGFLLALAATV